MGEAPDASVPATMYENATEEELCICADSNGLSIELVDTEERRYWINPGVTDWSHEKIQEWVEEIITARDYGITRLTEGPVEVEIYGEL